MYRQPPPEKESLSFSKRQKLSRGGNAGTSFGVFRHLDIYHNTPCLPPQILHNLCFYFPLGMTKALREIKGTAYAKHVKWGGEGGAKKGDVEMAKVNSLSVMFIEPSMFLENPACFD